MRQNYSLPTVNKLKDHYEKLILAVVVILLAYFALTRILGGPDHTPEKLNAAVSLPYELDIQYNPFNITTVGSLINDKLYSTTAHPHIDIKRDLIYMSSYNNYDFTKG